MDAVSAFSDAGRAVIRRRPPRAAGDTASRPCIGTGFVVVAGLVVGVGCAKSRRCLYAGR
jgi:hypothetical protein